MPVKSAGPNSRGTRQHELHEKASQVSSSVISNGYDPLVSVVIPTCDRPRLLGRALESVLSQTYRRLEVLVVDDASEDPAAEVVERVARGDRRVHLSRLEVRGGAARARNAALTLATGDLVAFLDDDDCWDPQKVAKQVEYLNSHPDVGMVSCDYLIVDDRVRSRPVVFRGPRRYTADQVQWMNFPGSFSFVMIRRDRVREELSLDEAFPSVEDWDLWLRCARLARTGVVRQPLVRHTVHGGLSVPASEQLGLGVFIRKHALTLPTTCRIFLEAHLRMLSGRGWAHRGHVARSLVTRSPRASVVLLVEQLSRQVGQARGDPGLVSRTVARLVGPDGRAGLNREGQ